MNTVKRTILIIVSVVFFRAGLLWSNGIILPPDEILLDFQHNLILGNYEEVYNLLSTKDKEMTSIENLKKEDVFPLMSVEARNLLNDLFNIEIMNIDVGNEKAFVKYKEKGPHNLYMDAWRSVSEKNKTKIESGGATYKNSEEFLELVNEEILSFVKEKKYEETEVIRTQALLMEDGQWRIFLNIERQEYLSNVLRLMQEADKMLRISEFGEIKLTPSVLEDRLAILDDALGKYERAKNMVSSLEYVSEEDIELQKRILRTLGERISKTKNYRKSDSLKGHIPKGMHKGNA